MLGWIYKDLDDEQSFYVTLFIVMPLLVFLCFETHYIISSLLASSKACELVKVK